MLKQKRANWYFQVRRDEQYAKADYRSLVVGTNALKRKTCELIQTNSEELLDCSIACDKNQISLST